MVNHSNRSKRRYKVRSAPTLSDDNGVSYIAVIGPDVNTLAVMKRIAALLEVTLNAADAFASTSDQ